MAEGNNSLYGWFASQELSTHYWVAKDGRIEQYVPDTGAAYGQGIVSSGSDFPAGYPGSGQVYNQMALSIEREGYHYEEPTPAQWRSIVALNRWLAYAHAIPVDDQHIVGHYRTDHVSRINCPSSPSMPHATYMARLIQEVQA